MYSESEDGENPGDGLTDEEWLRERAERQGQNGTYGNPTRLREIARELQVLSPLDPEAIRIEKNLSISMQARIDAFAEAEQITSEDTGQIVY